MQPSQRWLIQLVFGCLLLGGCVLDRSGVQGVGAGGQAGSASGGQGGDSLACGNGIVEIGEQCDDGNSTAGDGCDGCQREAGWQCLGQPSLCNLICGDGVVVSAAGEDCDDNNQLPGDGCDANCVTELGYQCDAQPSVCSPICGDGLIIGNESCDDQNALSDDGCSDSCELEAGWICADEPTVCTAICGDWLLVSAEECDDGNLTEADGCDASCHFEATCGNGNIEPGEQCDDNNLNGGDGCDAQCKIEPTETCGQAVNLNGSAAIIDGDSIVYDGDTKSTGLDDSMLAPPSCTTNHPPGVPAAIHRYTLKYPGRLLLRFDYVEGGLYDTLATVYVDCLGATEESCNDDVGGPRGDRRSQLITGSHPAGTTLYIMVTGWNALDIGAYRLRISEIPEGPKPAVNTSNCAMPVPIAASELVVNNLAGTNVGTQSPSCGGDGAAEAVLHYAPTSKVDATVLSVGLEPNHNVVLASMDSCGSSERVCSNNAPAAGVERLIDDDVPPGDLFLAVDGLTPGVSGYPATIIDALPLLPQGSPCIPSNPSYRCETQTACAVSGSCVPTLIDDRFDQGLGAFFIQDKLGTGTWALCGIVGCTLNNSTGSRSGKPFVRVTDDMGQDVNDVLVSGPHDGSAMANVFVEFDHTYDNSTTCPNDIASVGVSTDGGVNWTPIEAWTNDVYLTHEVIDLSAQAAGQSFLVGFAFSDGLGCQSGSWNIDDVKIYGY